jgi:exopolyphosphatase/guanosine-5'-triphosphate,3'-diphosphate pyrophosphatase
MAKITAVIDIGSNSARMAIFKKTSHFGFVLLKEIKSRVRISEGAYENSGNLQINAINRAINALKEFKLIAKSLKARKILAVATSAVRDAPNKQQFLNLVKKETGLQIKVIDGEKEAFFGAVATSNLLPQKNGITVDIGGGSTEFALIENKKIIDKISLKLGTVRLKELFFDKQDLKGAQQYIQEELSKLPDNFKNNVIFGIGGTIRALSKVIMKKNEYPLDILHGFTYKIEKEEKFINEVIKSDYKNLKNLGFKEDRWDVIREGSLILKEALKHIKATKIVTSGVGVREGVFLADILRNSNYMFPSNFNPSVKSIEDIYQIDKKTSVYESNLALKLFDILEPIHNLDKKYKNHLKYAIKLSSAGNYIDFYSNHKHTNYILLNALHYGFTHEDRVLISKIIRYHRKKRIKKEYIQRYKEIAPDKDVLENLSKIFFITKTLNSDLSNPKLELSLENKKLIIKGENLYLAKENFNKKECNIIIENLNN